MQQVFDTMSEATGVDFRDILKAQTYDAKVNRNINVSGITVPSPVDKESSNPADAAAPIDPTAPVETANDLPSTNV